MGIKVGDKVRVSKDAPRIYTPDWVDEMFNLVLKVTKVEDGNAMVVFAERTSYKTVLTAIPTKYLIKVDAEAKEPKYHKGDRVKVCSKNADRFGCVGTILEVHDNGTVDVDFNDYYVGGHLYSIDFIEPYTEPTAPKIEVGDMVRCKCPLRHKNSTDNDFVGMVTEVEGGWFRVRMNNGAYFQTDHESDLELVQPKEQTEAKKMPNVGSIKIPVEVDLSDSYWDAYTADLAKEIALKVANKYSDPKEAADYAVSVAKAVVENLKKK